MKQSYQILLIAGGILAAIGLILFAVCMGVLGWNFSALDSSGPYTAVTETFSATEVQQIHSSIHNRSIEIVRTHGDQITVQFESSKARPMYARLESGTVQIAQEQQKLALFNLFGFGGSHVVIAIPDSYTGALDLTTSNGAIESDQPMQLAKAHFQTSNASITIDNLSCDTLAAVTSNGRIEVENVSTNGRLYASTSNSPIELEKCRAERAELVTSNGKIKLEDSDFAAALSCKSSNGSIQFDELSAPDIVLKASNASIAGTINGRESDYRIESHTSNGNNSLHDSASGSKRLTAHTSNASIRIDFRER